MIPSLIPTAAPTVQPSNVPTAVPSLSPTAIPTVVPSSVPTRMPTTTPTAVPTSIPTVIPSSSPTAMPTSSPTVMPTSSSTELYSTVISIATGGSYTGTAATENFIIDSPLSVTVTGGDGIDLFTVRPRVDMFITITDFNPINERIDLTSFTNMHRKNDLNITEGSVLVNLPNSQAIKLLNLSPSQISEGNFVFSDTIIPTTHSQSAISGYGAIAGITIGSGVLLLGGIYLIYAAIQHTWPFKDHAHQTIATINQEGNEKNPSASQKPTEVIKSNPFAYAVALPNVDCSSSINPSDQLISYENTDVTATDHNVGYELVVRHGDIEIAGADD